MKQEKMLKNYCQELIRYSISKREEYMNEALAEYLTILDYKLGSFLEGELKGKKEIITNMYNHNLTFEEIAKYVGLDIDEVKNIIEKNQKNK